MSQLNRIVLIIAMNVLVYVLAVECYSDEFDNVLDIDAVLNNDTLREGYHNCYMKTAPCTKAQKDLTGTYVYNTTI
ncbi:hypothetical protein ALC56_12550 [Trachymyrmex septentrionalis]|uniref:Uncharacterized protein n=1 Tax=Trachymyrmex septentrionalis TaxID=34720 RepID=A0A195EZ82_9HYME|nr:PREDICTED: uncharacterized protein LOC108753733 [Trachymyrmex septentrionalis]KYN33217.1 hypothetical protein ALC56_12550 [Trachymyrmex septentrionalis]